MKIIAYLKLIGENILHWSWTKSLLYWIILSAGTMSECAFIVASLWLSLNASVHPFILKLLGGHQDWTDYLSYLSTSTYVALPECILGLAFVATLGHIRLYMSDRKNVSALIWAVLYGIPTLIFLMLSIYTLSGSVLNVTNFQLADPWKVARALAAYGFAFVAFLYYQLGKPQEADRLEKKDRVIGELTIKIQALTNQIAEVKAQSVEEIAQQKANFERQIEAMNRSIADLSGRLSESTLAQKMLEYELNKSNEQALEAYGEECASWLKNAHKSVLIEDAVRYTGHSIQKINGAIKTGRLKTTTRNDGRILVSSLRDWLNETPSPDKKIEDDALGRLRIVGKD